MTGRLKALGAASLILVILATLVLIFSESPQPPPQPPPEPERETSYLDRSFLARIGPVSLLSDLAHNWIRANHDSDAVFLSPDRVWANHNRVHRNQRDEETLMASMLNANDPLDVTVKGSLRSKGSDYKFRLSYHIEGMDDHQTVFYVTKWSINP